MLGRAIETIGNGSILWGLAGVLAAGAFLILVTVGAAAYIKGDLTFGWIRSVYGWVASMFKGKQ